MEGRVVGGLTDETFTFERVHTTGAGRHRGGSRPTRADSSATAAERRPAVTADAPRGRLHDSPARRLLGITSYVGVPVRDTRHVVATLCGIDRGHVAVDEHTIDVLRQLGAIIAAHLQPLANEGVVIRRMPEGGWTVGEKEQTGDLTSAMVLADLLAAELAPGGRPPRSDAPLDEVGSCGCRCSSSSTPWPPASSSSRRSAC
jgi:hypothetical protein